MMRFNLVELRVPAASPTSPFGFMIEDWQGEPVVLELEGLTLHMVHSVSRVDSVGQGAITAGEQPGVYVYTGHPDDSSETGVYQVYLVDAAGERYPAGYPVFLHKT